jgi:cyclic pyranopterin phosphate synthase
VEVDVLPDPDEPSVRIVAEVGTTDRTGVEMEALTAVCAAALTIYDMLKSTDRGMSFESIQLEHKSGGRSGTWERKRSK